MKRTIHIILLVCILSACCGVLFLPKADAAAQKATLKQGDQLRFETGDVDGNELASEDFFGANRITVVNIWATWCKPCVAELEDLAAMHTRIRKSDCGVAGIIFDGDTALAECKKLMKEKKVNYPVILPSEDMPWLEEMKTLPVTLFVDGEGKLLCDPVTGASPEKYEEVLTELLKKDQSAGKTAAASSGTQTHSQPVSSGSTSDGQASAQPAGAVSEETTVTDYGSYSVVCTGDACHIEYKTGEDGGAVSNPGTSDAGQASGGTASGTEAKTGSREVPVNQREHFVSKAEEAEENANGKPADADASPEENADASDSPSESPVRTVGMRELYEQAKKNTKAETETGQSSEK